MLAFEVGRWDPILSGKGDLEGLVDLLKGMVVDARF